MSVNSPVVIETYNLSNSYKGVQALTNLNLTVNQDSIFGFLRSNGAGKSTTWALQQKRLIKIG